MAIVGIPFHHFPPFVFRRTFSGCYCKRGFNWPFHIACRYYYDGCTLYLRIGLLCHFTYHARQQFLESGGLACAKSPKLSLCHHSSVLRQSSLGSVAVRVGTQETHSRLQHLNPRTLILVRDSCSAARLITGREYYQNNR